MEKPVKAEIAINYLGIDWGEKAVGVALGHSETRLALALTILENDGQLWEKLSRLLSENEVGTIVVGVPQYQERGTAVRAEAFSQELKKHFPDAKVEVANEMFTSKMAERKLQERGGKDREDHAEAARILLEDWLVRKM